MQLSLAKDVEALVQVARVLVVEDDPSTRKVIRTLLTAIGVKATYEAGDGMAGLDMISSVAPSLVILDWEMPHLHGADFVRAVRSPGNFPFPDVPIIMLTGHSERWRVIKALRLGVHEYLVKPVSIKSLLERMVSVLANPRPIVQSGGYYGPVPRKPLAESSFPASQDVVLLG